MIRRTVLILISLPALFALFDAVAFHLRTRNNGTIVSSGIEREYLLHVPRSYDPSRPAPLVISLHGAGTWPSLQRDLSRWNRVADEEGFLVVYPAGIGKVWGVNRGPGLTRDVRFISDLIDELRKTYNIDPARIYANGLSNGGGMSFVLSCALSDRIAAAGMVGAALTLPSSWCTDTRAVPLIAFHGTADPVTPYAGGKTWVAPRAFPGVPGFVADWARRNRCGGAIESDVALDVSRRAYTNCASNASVVFYTLRGGGHTWPGGQPLPKWFMGPTSTSIDATREMWAFFKAHPLAVR